MSPGWPLHLHRLGPRTPAGPPGLSVVSLTALEPALSLGRLDALPVELSVEIWVPMGHEAFKPRQPTHLPGMHFISLHLGGPDMGVW